MSIGRQASLKSQEVPETDSFHKRPLLGYKNNKQLLGRRASPAVQSSLQEDLQPGKLPESGGRELQGWNIHELSSLLGWAF